MKMNSIFFLAIIGCALAAPDFLHMRELHKSRIVGGDPVKIEEYPYQLSLQLGSSHHCGASIISPQWALTAAHCINSTYINYYALYSNSSFSDINSKDAIIHNIIKYVVHEPTEYGGNDIALIQISDSFIREDSVASVVKLPEPGAVPDVGAPAVVTGWGYLKFWNKTMAGQLRAVKVPIVDWSECANAYAQGPKPAVVDESMICAGLIQGGKDSCRGDSGGPLVIDGVQVGIVSWGKGCGFPSFPGVYSHVGYLRNWIRGQSGV